MRKAFTLVELMIVVAILGILAMVAIPAVQGQAARARDAVAITTLKTLRHQIELYKFNHKNQLPGFINGFATTPLNTVRQFTNCTKKDGSISPFTKPSGTYVYGPYLPKMPKNIYNGLSTIKIVPDATDFSVAANDLTGWLYKLGTGEIRINSTGMDADGVKHCEY